MPGLLASVRVALDALRGSILRTALSTLGVVMGAGSLAAVLSLADGGERLARQQVEREGLQMIQLRPQTDRVVDGLRVPIDRYPTFGVADALALAAAVDAASGVVLTMEGNGSVETSGQRDRLARIVGQFELRPTVTADQPVAEGRPLSEAETHQGAPVAVINGRLADALRATGSAGGRVGESVTVGGMALRVVGVRAPIPNERFFAVVVPFAVAERAIHAGTASAPALAVQAPDVDHVQVERAAIERFATGRAAWQGRYTITAYGLDRLQQVAQGMRVFRMLMGAFTGISLFVGGIGIANVLLSSILERTREIGVRKAAGARRRDIFLQFLVESSTISVLGAAAGAALGVAGAFAVTAVIRLRTQAPLYAAVTWQTLAITALSAIVVGLVAGIYPALRASRLTVIDAIQRE